MKLSLFVLLLALSNSAHAELPRDFLKGLGVEDAAKRETAPAQKPRPKPVAPTMTTEEYLARIEQNEAEKRRAADRARQQSQRASVERDVREAADLAVRAQTAVAPKCAYTLSPSNEPAAKYAFDYFTGVTVYDADFRAAVTSADYEFNPTVVIDSQSGWSAKEVADALEKTTKIYAQCGIRIGQATVVTGTYAPSVHPFDTNSEAYLAAHIPKTASKPWMFFIDHRQQSEFNGGAGTSAAFTTDATGNNAVGGNRFMKGSAFIAKDSVVKKDGKPTGYKPELVIGHELAHILTDGDHQPGENGDPKHLLADKGDNINGKITAAECGKMRSSPYVRKL